MAADTDGPLLTNKEARAQPWDFFFLSDHLHKDGFSAGTTAIEADHSLDLRHRLYGCSHTFTIL